MRNKFFLAAFFFFMASLALASSGEEVPSSHVDSNRVTLGSVESMGSGLRFVMDPVSYGEACVRRYFPLNELGDFSVNVLSAVYSGEYVSQIALPNPNGCERGILFSDLTSLDERLAVALYSKFAEVYIRGSSRGVLYEDRRFSNCLLSGKFRGLDGLRLVSLGADEAQNEYFAEIVGCDQGNKFLRAIFLKSRGAEILVKIVEADRRL
jgi:hypothetical protein